ncbi:MAG: ABC transporter permease [Candidatus Aminicenantes bacterium]|nr:ABC transporter permease [Candidatus Aminicenantes bacterium]
MFDLEKAVREWRKDLGSNPSLEEGTIAELEESLRDDIREFVRQGMTEEQAFSQIVAEMGRADDVGAEFYKVYTPRRWGRPSWQAPRFVPGLAWDYFRVAVRKFRRQKFGAFINLSGLAAGLAVCILISLWVRDELGYDKYLTNRDHLYLLTIEHPNGVLDPNVPYALPPALAREYPEIRQYSRIYKRGMITTCSFSYQPESGPRIMYYEDSVNLVDAGFFSMFSFPFIHGDPANALLDPNSLVLRDEAARKYFGDENPVGKKMTFNNRQDFIVSGVIRVPANSHLRPDFVALITDALAEDWDWRDPSYVLLDPKTSLASFREKIAGSFNKSFPHPPPGIFKVGLLPVANVYLGFGRMPYIYMFSVIAVFILAIACINYMNLATARAGSRGREVGLRKVVGAGRGQLIQQFLGEALLMSVLAFGLALALALVLLPFMNGLTGKSLTLFSGKSPLLLGYLLGLTVLVGLVAGSYPALLLSARRPVDALRVSLSFRSRRSPFRVVSVVGQFTISVLLIACTAVVFRQLNYIRNSPLGMSVDNVLQVRNNPSLQRGFDGFKRELLLNPRVLSVTRSQDVPFNEDYKTGGVEWDGKDPALMPLVRYSITDFDLFETFGMEFAAGRSFSADLPGDRANYVINQKAATYMGLKEPVGQRLRFGGQEGRIIGVVKDYHHVSLHREILPQVFTINPRFTTGPIKFVFIKLAPGDLQETLRAIREAAGKYAPDYPFEAAFLDRGTAALYESEQRLGKIFTAFAFLAIFISCLGILGLAVYSAEQRTKEIGVRKVLGSSVPGIVALLSKRFSLWVLGGNLIAWPIAYYAMHRWLRGFAYRTGIGLDVFILAGLISMFAAALPIVYQSLKAAVANPVKALRYE